MRTAALRAAAVAIYLAYWSLWTYGYLDIHRTGVVTDMPRLLFGALVIGAPCFLVGAAIGRWWAPAVGLVFVAFVAIGERCIAERLESDVSGIVCWGFEASWLPLCLAVTTPCVLAGVAAVKILARLRRPAPAV